MRFLSKSFLIFTTILILVSCTAAPTPTQVPTPLPEEHPTPIPPIEVPTTSPTDVPNIEEEVLEEVLFSFHDTDRKSILPTQVYELFSGTNYEPGAVVLHDGIFHILYNVLTDFPPTRVEIGYARSEDGVNWEQVSEGSIFSAEDVPYANNVVLASDLVVEEDGTWVLYFHTSPSASDQLKVGSLIGRATASGPEGPWLADPEPALIPAETGWDSFEVKYPCVLQVDGTYYMYYQGMKRFSGSRAFGLATSEDGIHWTRWGEPIFTADLVPGEEYASIRYPAVIYTPSGWLLLYRVEGAQYSVAYNLAISPDGIRWRAGLDTPVLIIDQYPTWPTAFSVEFERKGSHYYTYIQTIDRNGQDGSVSLFKFDKDLIPGENLAEMPAISFTDGMDVPMVQIPAGEFIMGSDRGEDDAPPHLVYLDSYAIDKYEVSNQLFVQFLNEFGNQKEENTNWLRPSLNPGIIQKNDVWSVEPGYEKHPVRAVSWYGAQAFCEWRGGRLPTEAEWEKAARGSEGLSPFPWGKGIDCDIANYSLCNLDAPYRIGNIPENVSPYGVYDMAGNLGEFTHDWYAPDYYQNSPYKNPTGPESSPLNTVASRGGSFFSTMTFLKVYHRVNEFHRYDGFRNVGFRCAIPPVGTRANPVQLGDKGDVEDFQLQIRDVIRPANDFIQDLPAENPQPEPGHEYMVIQLVEICQTQTIIDCHIREYNLKLTGSSGMVRKPERIRGFVGLLYSHHMPKGESLFGYLVFEVQKDEEELVLFYESDIDKTVYLAVD